MEEINKNNTENNKQTKKKNKKKLQWHRDSFWVFACFCMGEWLLVMDAIKFAFINTGNYWEIVKHMFNFGFYILVVFVWNLLKFFNWKSRVFSNHLTNDCTLCVLAGIETIVFENQF